ncbi:MAG: gamma-glutamyltransferase family protein [Planctomycetota bacterium]
MSDPSFQFGRPAVTARRGMAASSQTFASGAGIGILRAGGNAADAAVAMAAVLNLTEPTSTGIGGDCFALTFDAQTKKITALNGSGRAPARLTPEHLREDAPYHANTVTVPGACAGWCDLIERHGSMPLSDVLAPAIGLAEEGFPVAPITAHFWAAGAGRLTSDEMKIDGRAPRAGETFRNPGLARTFRAVADGGKDAFYRGAIAGAIVRTLREHGGVMEGADLAEHESTWEEPISTTYGPLRVWECPPNGQGLAALLALNLLKGFDLAPGPGRWHLMVEAMRLAFADARWYVSDPTFGEVPVDALLSNEYAEKRRRLIRPDRTTLDSPHGSPSGDTVYFCTVDGRGNACSFINSNYMGFGTGIVPPGRGFTLQNRGHNFTLDPAHPNAPAPRKRPYHTIIPGMLTREEDGSLYGPFGVMGGFMQPQGHVQAAVGLVNDGLDPQEALDRARFCLRPAEAGGKVHLEEGAPGEVAGALREKGHAVVSGVTGFGRAMFGRGQVIRREPEGLLVGGSDPRADGCALGL